MPINDILKALLPIGTEVGNDLSQFLLQRGNPQAYAQIQENQRAAQQIAAQLNLHSTMTPYEQASVNRWQQSDEGAAAQQAFENQLRLQQGIAQGYFQPASPGDPNSITAPGAYEGDQDLTVAPRTQQTHSILADSPVGKSLGLTEDLTGLSTNDYARYVLPQLEKLSVAQDKASQFAANGKALDAAMPSNLALIRQRFSPAYYQPLGMVDPSASTLQANFESRLAAAAETDKKNGNMAKTAEVMKELAGYESGWEKSRSAQLQRQLEINARAQANASTASDRSYQFHERELDQLAKPINDLAGKVAGLNDELNQGSPVADALVAPKLLSVLVGGQGSGLRMNEAEISRVVGGRSNWESLKAKAAQWATDPAKANTITPAQRGQIRALVNEVAQKVQSKQAALNQGYADLAGSDDPLAHRKIYDRTRKAVLDVDASPQASSVVDSLVNKYR